MLPQVFQVAVHDDNAFAGVASAPPVPVRVVTADRPWQSQFGTEAIDCASLTVETAKYRGLLSFFRGKSVVVARYGFDALLPSETIAVVVGDGGVQVVFDLDSVRGEILVAREGIDREDWNTAGNMRADRAQATVT